MPCAVELSFKQEQLVAIKEGTRVLGIGGINKRITQSVINIIIPIRVGGLWKESQGIGSSYPNSNSGKQWLPLSLVTESRRK